MIKRLNDMQLFVTNTFHKNVAIASALALVFWSISFTYTIKTAHAAGLSEVSDTLSNSAPSETSDHTIQFTAATQMDDANGGQIIYNFEASSFGTGGTPGDFTTGILTGDLTLTITGETPSVVVGAATATEWGLNVSNTDQLILDQPTGATNGGLIEVSDVVTLTIANARIDNPTTEGSFDLDIDYDYGGATNDGGGTQIAIINDVDVFADVNEVFEFYIDDVFPATVNGEAVAAGDASVSEVEVDFGELAAGTAELLGHTLRARTNSTNGFIVTVEADQTLTSSGGDTIDTFADASDNTVTGGASGDGDDWVAPTGSLGFPDTYGHWGITSSDDNVSNAIGGNGNAFDDDGTAGNAIATPQYAGDFVNNPVPIFGFDGPIDGRTVADGHPGAGPDAGGFADIGYKAEISAYQEAGIDYTAQLTFVATATF